ncbi:MAG: hypothetical protein GYB42_06815 [Alphaproteobacteria bacterium]|nr:hypothetical protein [Alphaproteobacteria bacterium]
MPVSTRTFSSLSLISMAGLAIIGLILALPIELPGAGALSDKARWFAWCGFIAGLVGFVLAWRGAPKAGWLAMLLVVSGGAQLWLSDPGWYKTFQYSGVGRLGKAMYGIILLQAFVSVGVLAMAKDRQWLSRLTSVRPKNAFRLLLVFGVLCVFSVSLMGYMWRYERVGFVVQLILSSIMVGVNLLALLALVFASDLDHLRLPDVVSFKQLPIVLAVAFFVVAAIYSLAAFGHVPIVEDETAFLFQAKTFAGGALQAPPLPEGVAPSLEYYLITADVSGWYAATAPGWPAILAIGVVLGVPFLINPALGGLSVWLGFGFWNRVGGREQALLVAFLMASSPWLLGVSASLMTHALVLSLTLGAWWLAAIAKDETPSWRPAVLLFCAGLMMGWIFLTRALEGVLLGGLTGFWILWVFTQRKQLLPVLAYGLGCFLTGALLFVYNLQVNGTLLETPLAAYVLEHWGEGANAFGIGKDIGAPSGWGALDLWPGHSALEGAINFNNSAVSLNTELFGWSVGSLLFVLVFLVWKRPHGPGLLMAVIAGTILLVHVFYWFTGTFYVGPRYWFGAFFAFIALSALGALSIKGSLDAMKLSTAAASVVPVVVLLGVFSLTVFSTWRGVEKYHPRGKYARVMAAYDLPTDAAGNAIVLLPCQRLFDGAMHLNDPFRRGAGPLFVFTNDEAGLDALQAAFPDRQFIDAEAMKPACKR